MKIFIRSSMLIIGLFITLGTMASDNQSHAQQVIEARVEALRKAMIDPTEAELKSLTSRDLSYGHSGGHVDNQAEFIDKLLSGKSDFVTMELRDQSIQIVKDIAIVRHNLIASTNDNGKPNQVDIGVMLIWQKQNNQWKLLARQAFKPH